MGEYKKKPIYGLEKIPDKAWIKVLEKQVEELDNQVVRKEEQIKELKKENKELKKLSPNERLALNRDNEVKALKAERTKLRHKIYTLQRDLKNFIAKNINLKLKLETYEKTTKNHGGD